MEAGMLEMGFFIVSSLIGLAIPIATLVLSILIYSKVKRLEKNLSFKE